MAANRYEKEGKEEITRLLHAYSQGDEDAYPKLFALAYDELHVLAHQQLIRRRPGQTINTTALVHEAYLKLLGVEASWKNRGHFLAVMAKAMRQILVDLARKVQAHKRKGQADALPLDAAVLQNKAAPDTSTHLDVGSFSVDILDLDAALTRLAALNPRLSEVVELRFFGGLSVETTSEVLGVAYRTVVRDWVKARSFLVLALRSEDDERH